MAGPISHNPACAVVRCGEMRAWCDCDEGLIARLRACEGDYAEVSTFTLRRAADRIEALLAERLRGDA